MRTPDYLSPTSIGVWRRDRREFYLIYLADNRPPRIPQTQAMAIGAAFDAYVKSHLHERIFGKGANPVFEFTTLFEAQVEKHNRDWAMRHGAHVFNSYRDCGALSDLMLDLNDAEGEPQFEMQITGRIVHSSCIGGIILLGKPDIHFINKSGAFVVYDWKVNGYMSASTTSPKKGYVKIYDAFTLTHSNQHGKSHKDCQMMLVDGIYINIAHYMEDVDQGWTDQTTIYSWILGAEVGSKFTVAIDQIVCKGSGNEFPYLRVAMHRNRVSEPYQLKLHDEIADIWTRVKAGKSRIFDEMTPEESVKKCDVLDLVFKSYQDDHKYSDWFNVMSRSHSDF
jgi:hypothetical protein